MDLQVDGSSQNQNLRMDLRWVFKWICKSARKFTQVTKSHTIHTLYTDDLCSLLPCVGWPNSEKLALTRI